MESVSEALKRLADGASAEGFPTDAYELREVEKRVAELIAADEECDAAKKALDDAEDEWDWGGPSSDFDAIREKIKSATARFNGAEQRRAAALLACKGQDHER